MAEVLGPVGFCFGCISFVLSTVPTAAKALDDFSQCVEYFQLYETRLVRSKARADKWNMYWRDKSDFGEHETVIERTKKDIDDLCQAIEDDISSNITDEKERKTWRHLKRGFRCGRFRKPRANEKTVSFIRSVGFVLFEKSHIEGWLTRLETAIDCIEKVSETVFAKRTAEHFNGSPSRAQVLETKELECFLQGITLLAQKLHEESSATTNGFEPETYGWALGLRPPAITVEHWKFIAEVNIEMRFSTRRSVDEENHFHLDVPFHKDDKRTHLDSEQIKSLVRRHTTSKGSPNTTNTAAKCSTQHPKARRTRPIGDLLKHAPKLFQDEAWRQDRATLVRGLSHWAILLWDTAWMEELCCYGLQIEKGVVGKDCISQMFNVGECPKYDRCHHGSRLRNLGIVLAQLVLGKLIRRTSQNDTGEYQQWVDGEWKVLYRSDIIAEVFVKTTSIPLSDAISFCLKDESALANDPFQPGFLFECIDHIYKPYVPV
ncbi:hypothetical protein N0V83_000348 [Neocucurbitaria cava]|uniref:Prion-inhibition and propagation HeLo domain-containing protein n=1 Tax=Neocucurbitaria cava TaxID=798079 RepID=A0A9W8YHC4_9PLEO|nr:hypothetical protein N0V83_000348 [Neocucurbitaria cava]